MRTNYWFFGIFFLIVTYRTSLGIVGDILVYSETIKSQVIAMVKPLQKLNECHVQKLEQID